jgi:acyl-CoA thioesterase
LPTRRVDLEVTTLRAAKRAVSLRVSMTRRDARSSRSCGWSAVRGLEHDVTDMPPVPAPSQLKSMEDLVPPEDLRQRYRFWNNFEARPIDFVPWAQREPGAPEWREWYRFRPRATMRRSVADAARACC